MDINLNDEQVMQYLREKIEPVAFKKLVSEFCDAKDDEEARKQVATKLKDILISLINSGSIMHHNDHFYAATLADDLEGFVELNSEGDSLSNGSSISFSSNESIDENPHPNFDDWEEIDQSNSKQDSTVQKMSSSVCGETVAPNKEAAKAKEKKALMNN